jgi:hypothetical protein
MGKDYNVLERISGRKVLLSSTMAMDKETIEWLLIFTCFKITKQLNNKTTMCLSASSIVLKFMYKLGWVLMQRANKKIVIILQ